jgi:hypothetical protein
MIAEYGGRCPLTLITRSDSQGPWFIVNPDGREVCLVKTLAKILLAAALVGLAACNGAALQEASMKAQNDATKANSSAQSAEQASQQAQAAAQQADANASQAADASRRADDAVARLEAAFAGSVTK